MNKARFGQFDIDMDKLAETALAEHRDYLTGDIPAAQMQLEMEQHEKSLCFPTCFFCALDKTLKGEVAVQCFEQVFAKAKGKP